VFPPFFPGQLFTGFQPSFVSCFPGFPFSEMTEPFGLWAFHTVGRFRPVSFSLHLIPRLFYCFSLFFTVLSVMPCPGTLPGHLPLAAFGKTRFLRETFYPSRFQSACFVNLEPFFHVLHLGASPLASLLLGAIWTFDDFRSDRTFFLFRVAPLFSFLPYIPTT